MAQNKLTVYAALWCPHCQRTVEYLSKKNIPFEYVNIEKAPEEEVRKVVEANGGDDWTVPTLEFNGKWRPGKVFNEAGLVADLHEMGVC